MRMSRIGGLLALALAAPAALRAEPPKWVANVILEGVEVRSGASWQHPATGNLHKNEQVHVYFEQDGWLAISPPPGSVSWVNHLFLGEYKPSMTGRQNAVIQKNDTMIRVGTDLQSGPVRTRGGDSVRAAQVPAGTQVTIIGPKVDFENSKWYPIEPVEGELRYIARSAVGTLDTPPPPPKSAVAKNVRAVDPNTPAPAPVPVTPPTPPPATNTAAAHPSWGRAEQAEETGDWKEAERLYVQIYTDLQRKNADIDQLLACYNRIDRCKERGRGVAPTQPAPTQAPSTANNGDPVRPPASLQAPGSSEVPGAVVPVSVKPEQRPANSGTVSSSQSAPAAEVPEVKGSSSGPGYLRRAPFFIDNHQAYALESDRGALLYYVTAQTGVNLDGFINRQIELVGTEQPRGDIRGARYMTVARVVPLK